MLHDASTLGLPAQMQASVKTHAYCIRIMHAHPGRIKTMDVNFGTVSKFSPLDMLISLHGIREVDNKGKCLVVTSAGVVRTDDEVVFGEWENSRRPYQNGGTGEGVWGAQGGWADEGDEGRGEEEGKGDGAGEGKGNGKRASGRGRAWGKGEGKEKGG